MSRLTRRDATGIWIKEPDDKVCDTVWATRWWNNETITKKIDGQTWYRDVFQHKITKEVFRLQDYDRIGKDVFLTKEEAEAKLKELQND